MKLRIFIIVAAVAMNLPAPRISLAQVSPSFYDYVRGSLEWSTIETPHFRVHFHSAATGPTSERSARTVAEIAEEIYTPITQLYDYEPDPKVSIILRDFEDYSNGAAYFFDNVILLWAPALNTPFRGRHDWLRNVVAHEFTHIVQVQASMKSTRKVPFYYFQMLTYEDVRRPDVLYGYPDGIVTYPVPVLNNPAWFAEGTAQFQRVELSYDTWDTHRDMLLRTRALAGQLLTLSEMGGFYSHNSLERETVYNQGFAFTQYLANRFGESSLSAISRSLGSWSSWNFPRAARKAVGVDGADLYDDWVKTLEDGYSSAIADVKQSEVPGRIVHGDGFLNHHPKFAPDGIRYAFVSNRGRDFSQTSLYLMDKTNGEEVVTLESYNGGADLAFQCSLGHRIVPRIFSSFSWHPGGEHVVYSRRRDTPEGYYYADLYELDLERRVERRLTRGLRARDPSVAPDGRSVIFVVETDGTANLHWMDLESGAHHPVTAWATGEELGSPVWYPDGDRVAVGVSDARGKYIAAVEASSGAVSVLISDGSDVRDPHIGPQGDHLYFSSDATGIFNIYRQPLAGGTREQLTNVVGGAFQPSVSSAGSLIYSHYAWDGYKIARIDRPVALAVAAASDYQAPAALTKWVRVDGASEQSAAPTKRDPTAAPAAFSRSGTVIPPTGGESERSVASADSVTSYRSDFTSFSFFPVVRLDQYVSRRRSRAEVRLPDRSRGEALIRNTKLGFYFASRDVLEGMSMFGGLLLGPSSGDADGIGDFFAPANLLGLERDLFVQFDYNRGIVFRTKRWSPQLSVQLFNVRRNVENGLAFEELACTACFPPDTTLADLSYNLWELDIAARSKLSRSVLLEAGYRFSPYRVTTERFFSREFQQTINASSSRYYIGKAVRLKAYFEAMIAHRHADVVPAGLKAELTYEYEPGRLLDRFSVEDGQLVPEYERFNIHRLTADVRYSIRLRHHGSPHGIGIRLRGSTILGDPVNDFFDDYVGGLIGARGYPFYALGGNETLWMQAAYHIPLLPDIRRQILFLYLDKVYARVYADAAYAWSGPFPTLSDARRDIGAEIRIGLGSFYLLPTAAFVSATYGLDEFDFNLDEDFVTPDGSTSVSYGRELQWHFGILFGFDL